MSDTQLHERFAPVFQRIAQGAVQREQERTLAFDAVAWLKDADFGALRVPRSQGGLGATLPELFALLIELGSADSNLPQIVRAHFGFVEGRLVSQDSDSQAYWFPKVVAGQLWAQPWPSAVIPPPTR